MMLLIALILFAALAYAAMRWGADSIEAADDPEWGRRKAWRGFAA